MDNLLPQNINQQLSVSQELQIGDYCFILGFYDNKIIIEQRKIIGENRDSYYLEGRGEKLKEFCFKNYYDLLGNVVIKFDNKKNSSIAKEFKKAISLNCDFMLGYVQNLQFDKKIKKEILNLIKTIWK